MGITIAAALTGIICAVSRTSINAKDATYSLPFSRQLQSYFLLFALGCFSGDDEYNRTRLRSKTFGVGGGILAARELGIHVKVRLFTLAIASRGD
jgi:hypothetical protein